MITYMKAGCLAVYLVAVLGAFAVLPFGIAPAVQYLAAILLALHALEVLVAFRSVRQYPGSLVDSIALTLLFGFLHWKPLARRT